MKVIVAGSRTLDNRKLVEDAIRESGFQITELVCGGSRGVDVIAANLCRENGIPVKMFVPLWDELGKAAGPIRNKWMAEYAEALILCWDGHSRGSWSMLQHAIKLDLKIYIHFSQKIDALRLG